MFRFAQLLPVAALLGSLIATSSNAQIGQFTLSDWPTTDAALKPLYVSAMMEQAQVNNVIFTQDAAFYVSELNRFASFAQSHNVKRQLTLPVTTVLASIALVHCDWNNGTAPRDFAQKHLGAETLAVYSELYPEQVARLERNCDA